MMLETFISNPFYIFTKMLNEIKEKLPPKYTKRQYIFLLKVALP